MKPLTLYGCFHEEFPNEKRMVSFGCPASVEDKGDQIKLITADGRTFWAEAEAETSTEQGTLPNKIAFMMWRRGNDE